MKVMIREEKEPYSKTGVAWRAYEPDGTPMYMGAETQAELETRVREFHPTAEFEVEPKFGVVRSTMGRFVNTIHEAVEEDRKTSSASGSSSDP